MKEIKLIVDDITDAIIVTAVGTKRTVTHLNTKTFVMSDCDKNKPFEMEKFKERKQ